MSRLNVAQTLVVLLAGAVLTTPTVAAQTTWYVDDDAPNDPGPGDPTVSDPNEAGTPEHPFDAIQEGIDAALDGDTVLVLDGTYTGTGNKNLDFHGKAITVRSENGPDVCVIDCEGQSRGFRFLSGESAATTVDGFTITNGSVTCGGAIRCDGASPTITSCILVANAAEDGGGICCKNYSSPAVRNCLIIGNTAERGGGAHLARSAAVLTNCTIAANQSSAAGGGLNVVTASDVTVANCILSGNQAPQGPEINLLGTSNPSTLTISYSDVHGGETVIYVREGCTLIWEESSIDSDPLFVAPEASDYHLQPGSLCIDAGTNDPPGGLPLYDLDGVPRPLDGDGDVEHWSGQFETADMGAYEYEPPTTPLICRTPAAFDFVGREGDPNPDPQTLSIWNCGIGTLNWEIDEDCPWLEVNPLAGHSAGEINEVTLSVEIAGLPRGDYACTFGITDPAAANSPQAVDVNLRVLGTLHVPSEYPTIQPAIDAAYPTETVLVADGTYTGEGNKDLDFGGKPITVRSENGPENCIIDCENDGRGFYFHSGETADAVVDGFTITTGGVDGGAVYCEFSGPTLSACIITGNLSRGMYNYASAPIVAHCVFTGNAGGMFNHSSSPTLTECVFSNNVGGDGGGMYNKAGSHPTVNRCTFSGNHASGNGGGMYNYADYGASNPILTDCLFLANTARANGGGMFNSQDCSPTLANCAFVGNRTLEWDGGGMYNGKNAPTLSGCSFIENSAAKGGGMYNSTHRSGGCSPTLISCAFQGNSAETDGGGMYNESSYMPCSPTLANCVFSHNTASGADGGMHNYSFEGSSRPTLTNCTFVGNSASHGSGLASDSYHQQYPDNHVRADNSIFWDGADGVWSGDGSTISITYSDVAGGWPGEGNIDADPLFVDPDGPDGDPNTFEDNDYRLSAGSPCIDAADNEAVPADTLDLDGDGDTEEPIPFDLDGNPRFVDDPDTDDTGNGTPPIVDMGAYELQVGIVAYLDIKPGSCPNSLNVRRHGVVPMAIVGTADFDVTQIDVDTLVLTRADGVGGSLTPLMGPPGPGIRVEDVATPFEGEPCDCHELGGDGIDDLSMKFDTEAVVAELELNDLPGGALVELVVSGESSDGAPFSASDCIRLVPPGAGSEGEPSGLPVGDHGLAGLPVGRQAMSPQDRSADDSSRQDTVTRERARSGGSESGDADQSEASQDAVAAPLAACGPLSSGLLLTMVAGIGLVRSRRR